MIIPEIKSSTVVTNIGKAPSRFKIEATARAFRVLSSFYSDPVGAIPRELGANAWDAHVAAKNTGTPFTVHAPNELEPWFSIRDYGTGLSPEDIDTIYTTYFKSTKTHDNDSDGCMGLGSKTPFNYTENFTVTSYFEGVKSVYNCFINENSEPVCLPVFMEESDEHNGLEIKFAVKKDDISMFVNKISIAYEPFRHRPVITGADLRFTPRVYAFSTSEWGYSSDNGYGSRNRCFMGNYSYPIDDNAIYNYLRLTDAPDRDVIRRALNTNRFHLFFSIGDLDVAPNKEQLQYDSTTNKTSKAIVERIRNAIIEAKAQVDKDIEKPTSRWDAMRLHLKYNGRSSSGADAPLRSLVSLLGGVEIKFEDKVLTNEISVGEVHFSTGKISKPESEYRYTSDASLRKEAETLMANFSIKTMDFQYSRRAFSHRLTVTHTGRYKYTDKICIIYTDKDTIRRDRIRNYVQQNYPNLLKRDAQEENLIIYYVVDKTPGFSIIKDHAKYLGLPDSCLINVDAMPKPPRVPRDSTATGISVKDYIRTATLTDCGNRNRYGEIDTYERFSLETQEFKSEGTYYYIDYERSTPQYDGHDLTTTVMYEALAYLREHNLLNETIAPKIYGVNRTNVKVLKVGTWINFMDLAAKEIKKHKKSLEQEGFVRELSQKLHADDNLSRYFFGNEQFTKHIKSEDTRKMMVDYMDFLKKYPVTKDKYPYLYVALGIKAVKHKEIDNKVDIIASTFESKYFGVLTMTKDAMYYHREYAEKIAAIINFIDEKS